MLHLSFHRISTYALVTILLFAAWLRLDGCDWSLPFRFHPDEWKYVAGGAQCLEGEWNPKYFRNPPGFSYLNALWFPLWLHIRPPVEVPEWLGIDPVRLQPSTNPMATFHYRPFDLVLGSRVLSAFFGVLTVWIVFLLGQELGDWKIGGLAAALATVSFANVRECHFAVNDPAMTFWVCLALWLGIRAWRRDSVNYYWAASAVGGIAVAFKYNAFVAPAVLMVLWGIRYFRQAESEISLRALSKEIGVGAVLTVFCFLMICPFPILDSATFFAEIEKLSQAAQEGWPGQEKVWSGLLFLRSLFISEGVLSVVLSFAGFVLLVMKKRWEWLLFPLAYFFLIALHPLYFLRFSLPVLPWFSLAAAYAIGWIAGRFPQKPLHTWLPVCLVFLCILEPLVKDLRSNYLLKQEDTRISCLRWIRQQPAAGFIGADLYAFPIPYRGMAEPWNTSLDPRIVPLDRIPSAQFDQLPSYIGAPAVYMAISTFAAFPGYVPETYEQRREAIQRFCGTQKPVRTFPVFGGDRPASAFKAANVEDTYSPVTHLWKRKSTGPEIAVYQNESANP